MKKALIVLYKIGFWAYFLINIGVNSEFVSICTNTSPNVYDGAYIPKKKLCKESEEAQQEKVQHYFNGLLQVAKSKAKQGRYTPGDYFHDIQTILAFREHHGYTVGPYGSYTELMDVLERERFAGKFTRDDIEKARDRIYPVAPAAPTNWKAVGVWFWKLYLKMIPAVIVLFLLWLYEDSSLEKIKVRNPLGLTVAVVLHPLLFIFRTLEAYAASREGSSEVVVPKQELLQLFSEDELALVLRLKKELRSRARLYILQKVIELPPSEAFIEHCFKECSLLLPSGFPRLTDPIPLKVTTFLPMKNSKQM